MSNASASGDFTITKDKLAKNVTLFGEGRAFDSDDGLSEKMPISIPDTDRSGHLWCIGSTRAGKTNMMANMIEQDIRKGYSVLVLDPKLDKELFERIVQTTLEERRHEDLILINPVHSTYSADFDPLSHHYMIEELVGHLVSGVSVGRDPYFYNVAIQISTVVVEALDLLARYEGNPTKINLEEVKDYITRDMLEELKNQVESMDSQKLKNDIYRITKSIDRILSNQADYFNKVSNSLDVALQELTSGSIGRIVGAARENRIVSRLESGKRVIAVAQFCSQLTRRGAFTMGKVIMSVIQAFVGRIFASGKKERVNPPLCVYIDEAQNVLYQGIDDFFAKAGGADVWLHGFSQSVSPIFAEVGKDYGQTILANTNTKLFMRVPDEETADYVSRHFGERKVLSPMLSTSGGMMMREVEEPLVRPSDVLSMRRRQFFMRGYSGTYAGRTLDSSTLYTSIEFPEVSVED
ncbi:MAG: conjugal transfer protein TraG [bacterium]|nr:MAG: conjugal transfer protein TraG [bacterium]